MRGNGHPKIGFREANSAICISIPPLFAFFLKFILFASSKGKGLTLLGATLENPTGSNQNPSAKIPSSSLHSHLAPRQRSIIALGANQQKKKMMAERMRPKGSLPKGVLPQNLTMPWPTPLHFVPSLNPPIVPHFAQIPLSSFFYLLLFFSSLGNPAGPGPKPQIIIFLSRHLQYFHFLNIIWNEWKYSPSIFGYFPLWLINVVFCADFSRICLSFSLHCAFLRNVPSTSMSFAHFPIA
jgi:hypothetical protein